MFSFIMYIYFVYLKNMIYKLSRKKYKINIQQKEKNLFFFKKTLFFLESFAKTLFIFY